MLPVVSTPNRMIRGVRSGLRALLLTSALLGMGVHPAAAQTVDDDGSVGAQQLNLP